MNPQFPHIDYSKFKVNWFDFEDYYRDAKELYPRNMSKPRGKFIKTTAFVDASFGQKKRIASHFLVM